jgi:ribonuclease T2
MKKRAFPAVLILLLPIAACNPRPQPAPEPTPRPHIADGSIQAAAAQPFDYYLLNISWSPEYCHSHPAAIECAQHAHFVLHGLWPQNFDGSYPQNCSNAQGPADPSQFSDVYPDRGLLRHEWRTHGTCSGLSPDAFFTAARHALHTVAIPTELTSLDHQISMPPSQLLDLFANSNPSFPKASLVLSCGNNYLTAIQVCLNKALQPIACGPIHACRANSIRITPP